MSKSQWLRFGMQVVLVVVAVSLAWGASQQQIKMNAYRVECIEEKAEKLQVAYTDLHDELALMRGDVREIKLILRNATESK
tara:strand:+ start:2441 stop:2683 length:243 start_codon:yes stop_codon:yes gene_type:complete